MGTDVMREAGAGIASALFGRVRRRVLALVFRDPEREYHYREIVRRVDAGHGAVQRELKQLESCGLITATQRGNQVCYRANEGSPVFPELRALVMKTAGLADVLRDALAEHRDKIEVAFIFGSMADGTDRTDSDVDVMIVGDVTLWSLLPAVRTAERELGREVNSIVMSPEEFAARVAREEHLVGNVLSGPKVFLLGGEHDTRRLAG